MPRGSDGSGESRNAAGPAPTADRPAPGPACPRSARRVGERPAGGSGTPRPRAGRTPRRRLVATHPAGRRGRAWTAAATRRAASRRGSRAEADPRSARRAFPVRLAPPRSADRRADWSLSRLPTDGVHLHQWTVPPGHRDRGSCGRGLHVLQPCGLAERPRPQHRDERCRDAGRPGEHEGRRRARVIGQDARECRARSAADARAR